MINYRNYYIFNLLNPRAVRGFLDKNSEIFPDKRIKGAFRTIFTASKPLKKYFFAETTMKRIEPIDLEKVYPTKLGYLFDKYPNEVSICMCEKDKLGFVYIIGNNDIRILVTSGTDKTANSFTDEYGKVNMAPFLKTIVGSCIISYGTNNVQLIPNNLVSYYTNNLDFSGMGRDTLLKYKAILIEIGKLHKKEISFEELTKEQSPLLFYQYCSFHHLMFLAILLFWLFSTTVNKR